MILSDATGNARAEMRGGPSGCRAEGEESRRAALEALPRESPRRDRYDVALLDELKTELDRLLDR